MQEPVRQVELLVLIDHREISVARDLRAAFVAITAVQYPVFGGIGIIDVHAQPSAPLEIADVRAFLAEGKGGYPAYSVNTIHFIQGLPAPVCLHHPLYDAAHSFVFLLRTFRPEQGRPDREEDDSPQDEKRNGRDLHFWSKACFP